MLIEAGRTQTNKIVCTNNNNKVVRKNRCSSSLCVGAYLRFSLGAASAYHRNLKQVSVVMWLAPWLPIRESRVRIPSQHGNLVKFILVSMEAFLLSASRPFNRWPSVWFGSLSPLTAKWQATSAAEPNLRVTSTQLG